VDSNILLIESEAQNIYGLYIVNNLVLSQQCDMHDGLEVKEF